jgi:hypothetical protein
MITFLLNTKILVSEDLTGYAVTTTILFAEKDESDRSFYIVLSLSGTASGSCMTAKIDILYELSVQIWTFAEELNNALNRHRTELVFLDWCRILPKTQRLRAHE